MSRWLVQGLAAFAVAAAAAVALSSAAMAGGTVTLIGSVGPKGGVSLRQPDGRAVKELKAGAYVIVVTDRSRRDDFHLRGPGPLDKRTGMWFVGRIIWRVRLSKGGYQYSSDQHPVTSRRTFRVS
jgi:hypothetical protein